nr:SusC/RagA family TonB-linked outer membrane protein [Pedobacter panaciterrae]
MRLTTVILIASLMQVSASTFGQRVTLSKANASLFSVLKDIRKQTGYDFYYDQTTIPQNQKVSVSVSNATLDEALSNTLKGLNLIYEIDGKIVTIKTKENPSFLENIVSRFLEINVSGRVVDADGRGLPGASVTVKGKGGKAVSTGANGNFYLKGVDEDAILIISFIGYVSKEVNAVKEMGDVVLEQSLSKLDEVQVIAYGTTTQRLSTGNITTIKADVIEKQPVNNPLLALQGRVPGLFIEQGSGFAGTSVKVRIQGQNSINNGNDPLYVIDGVPFTSQPFLGGNGILGGGYTVIDGYQFGIGGSPLNYLNPSDIESIDVLKDADATAIYGSRAANGAILITTKKGKAGDIAVNANLQNGWGTVSRRLDLMNSGQYLEMRKEAFKNDGIAPGRRDYDLNGAWDSTRATDWQKELLGGKAKYTDIQVSVSGGNQNTTFLVGTGYHKEGNVFAGNFADTKASVHFNLNSTSPNQKFKLQMSGSYLDDNNQLPKVDLTSYAMSLPPIAPALYNVDGSVNWQPNATGTTTFLLNPMQYLFSKFKNKMSNLTASGTLSYKILEGLELRSSFGYNKLRSKTIDYSTSEGVYPEAKPIYSTFNFTNFGDASTNSWTIEPQITYKANLSKGRLEILIGSTIQNDVRDASLVRADGFNSDQVMEDIKSARTLTAGYSVNSEYKYNAVFGRINYNWEDKYILNLSARRDGSSRFGSENQFHNFGAIGGAWIFLQEPYLKDRLSFLSFGKLRASYGTTGNDQIGEYNFMSLYDAIPGILNPYQGTMGYLPRNLTNPYLQWEETRKLQIGLDLGFFNDRLLINTNYALNRSSNQLLGLAIPSVTGFSSIAANFPATVQNTGWEFMVSSINLKLNDFKWSSNLNLTIPHNKLLAFKEFENSSLLNTYVIGKSVNIQKLYKYSGVNPESGIYQFLGRNGIVTPSPVAGDNNFTISTDPKFYGGIQNTFEYKGFQLDFLFQFTKQIAQNYLSYGYPGTISNGLGNQPVGQLNRWQKSGDTGLYQKYSTRGLPSTAIFNQSDAVWNDASFIRLKNVSLSWRLPIELRKRLPLQNCRLYIQGQNLLTITDYLGLDPESKSSLSLPPLRVITMGIQIGI